MGFLVHNTMNLLHCIIDLLHLFDLKQLQNENVTIQYKANMYV